MHKYCTETYVSIDHLVSNIKWSHHSYIYDCLSKLSNIDFFIQENNRTINEKDLFGKFCSLNFLFEVFLTHQNCRMNYYPDKTNRNPTIDFCYLSYFLYKNGASGKVPDYRKYTFEENITAYLHEAVNNKNKFIPDNFQNFITSDLNSKKDFVLNLLKDSSLLNQSKYQHIYLSFYLDSKNVQKKLKV